MAEAVDGRCNPRSDRSIIWFHERHAGLGVRWCYHARSLSLISRERCMLRLLTSTITDLTIEVVEEVL